nr:MAG TPA: hypothetical protein [Crassvirales sp.]
MIRAYSIIYISLLLTSTKMQFFICILLKLVKLINLVNL